MAVATVEDIRRIGAGTQPWALNNTALKSLRDSNEQPPGFPVGDGLVDLTNLDPCEVYTLHRTAQTAMVMATHAGRLQRRRA